MALLTFFFSYNKTEDLKHTIENTLKNCKSATDSLKYFMSNNIRSSYSNIRKVHVNSIQIIQSKMTLLQYQVLSPQKWQVIECRSSELPYTFKDRKKYIKVFELFAFIHVSVSLMKTFFILN
jgi:hypothetical protein